MLPYEINQLRWVNRSVAVVGIKFDASLFAEVIDTLTVFPAGKANIIPFRRFKCPQPLDRYGHFVLQAK